MISLPLIFKVRCHSVNSILNHLMTDPRQKAVCKCNRLYLKPVESQARIKTRVFINQWCSHVSTTTTSKPNMWKPNSERWILITKNRAHAYYNVLPQSVKVICELFQQIGVTPLLISPINLTYSRRRWRPCFYSRRRGNEFSFTRAQLASAARRYRACHSNVLLLFFDHQRFRRWFTGIKRERGRQPFMTSMCLEV